jgi:hypothetical protein
VIKDVCQVYHCTLADLAAVGDHMIAVAHVASSQTVKDEPQLLHQNQEYIDTLSVLQRKKIQQPPLKVINTLFPVCILKVHHVLITSLKV